MEPERIARLSVVKEVGGRGLEGWVGGWGGVWWWR